MVIDDSRAMRRIEREVLSRLGRLEIIEADNGASAIEKLYERDFQVDLILVDWVMPRMNGLTFVRHLKQTPALSSIPILMVTSCSDEHRMAEARSAGVDGYLLKPFTKELFLRAILSLNPDADDVGLDEMEDLADSSEAPGDLAPERTFLEDLPVDMRRRVLDMSIVLHYVAGETVLANDTEVGYFYYVIDGEVREQQPAVGCSGALIRKYRTGDCFAATELMSGDVLTSKFVAWDDARVGRLPHAAFEGMLLKFPEIGITLSRVLATKAQQLDVEEEQVDAGLSGVLEILDLPALIQAISLRQKTCLIELDEIDAEICFLQGQVVAASCGDMIGSEAFFQILEKKPRAFRLAAKPDRRERNVHESTMNLLLEAARRCDEHLVC